MTFATSCRALALLALTLATDAAPLPAIRLPEGFRLAIWADDVPDARSLRLGPGGTVFVSTRKAGKVYALRDTNNDGQADEAYILASGLDAPNGIDLRDGALYVAETSRILRFPDIEKSLGRPPVPQVVRDDLPGDGYHGWRYIGFGPDGKLYLAVGAPCNVCAPTPFGPAGAKLETASISRMDPDGKHWETVARGVRNSVGFDWHPQTRELWFTDNGRDQLGDDVPDCELNHLGRAGEHFGFPFCHAGQVSDPEFGKARACAEFSPPARRLGPHVAPLGMRFYTGAMFPKAYVNQIFVAKHGSWNRSRKSGYTLNVVTLKDGKVLADQVFADGFLDGEETRGRPVDVLQLKDGSLLVSDDFGGRIFRITYVNP
ncbi:MAG TPA: PQQ-dependent sugar dehydrogenase [Solimonas sp.]|nr:PQQ-dependent sugar dehydrogenase [Solimonas sp.]